MSLSGASGSAAGYINLIVKIAILVVTVRSIFDMFCLRYLTCHALLLVTKIIFMMTLMIYHFDMRVRDVMILLLTSFLWIKLNLNLPKFLTACSLSRVGGRAYLLRGLPTTLS